MDGCGFPHTIRERILAARAIQQERFTTTPKIRCNARMSSKLLKAHCLD